MQTIEYRTHDKSEWGPGPWQSEPDKRQWRDEATGLPCLIVRGPSGALCGYVGVSRGHPCYGKDYDDVTVEVHWGLTFASKCAPEPTREHWEKWRAHAISRKDEARRFPIGDAARLLKERAKEIADYDAYVVWATGAYICHKVEDGEDDDVWWFGFDCAHSGDVSPAFENLTRCGLSNRDDTYKDLDYVTREVESLARQLRDLSN